MLWLLAKMEGEDGWPDRKVIVLAACDCAELALKYVPEGENRPRKAIETARKWAPGKATLEDGESAAYENGAYAAAETAAEAGAEAAAEAAAAAFDADGANYAFAYAYEHGVSYDIAEAGAAAAAEPAYAGYDTAEAAATVAAAVFKHCADIVRGYMEVED
jgi:hypothetical protein